MTLKDFVHHMGLTMGEFNRLDEETKTFWRNRQQERNRQEQIDREMFLKELETAGIINPNFLG